jgi:hypothetical protein
MHLNKVPLITHVTELSVLPNKLYLPHDHGDSTRSICPAGPISIGAGRSRSNFPAAGEELEQMSPLQPGQEIAYIHLFLPVTLHDGYSHIKR